MTTNFVRLVSKNLLDIYISRQAWESVRSVSNFSFAQCKGSGTIVKSVTPAKNRMGLCYVGNGFLKRLFKVIRL